MSESICAEWSGLLQSFYDRKLFIILVSFGNNKKLPDRSDAHECIDPILDHVKVVSVLGDQSIQIDRGSDRFCDLSYHIIDFTIYGYFCQSFKG